MASVLSSARPCAPPKKKKRTGHQANVIVRVICFLPIASFGK